MFHRIGQLVWRSAAWFLGAALALAVLLLAGGNLFGQYLLHHSRAEFPPPGRLISVNGHRLHMHCIGHGRPTVILEAGSGTWSAHWGSVQERIAEQTRVCAYDRAGYGWSEAARGPRDLRALTGDLEQLIAQSGEQGPYVLAGWSLGAPVAWFYAQRHPGKTAGLVSVDGRPAGFESWLYQFAPDVAAGRAGQLASLQWIRRLGLAPAVSWLLLHGSVADTLKGLPSASRRVLLDAGFQSRTFAAMAREASADESFEREMVDMEPLGGIPLTVIRHGRPGMFGLGAKRESQAEARWQQAQAYLAKQSNAGNLKVARMSGHNIPLEQPGIVVNAVEDMVRDWRRSSAALPDYSDAVPGASAGEQQASPSPEAAGRAPKG